MIEGFCHRVARWIAEMTASKGGGGELGWALMDAALDVTVIWSIREYVRRRQEKIAEYVAGRPIYELCTGADRMEGSSRFIRWWDQ